MPDGMLEDVYGAARDGVGRELFVPTQTWEVIEPALAAARSQTERPRLLQLLRAERDLRGMEPVFRFAIGVPGDVQSSTWRVWIGKGKADVYLGEREMLREVKVSLHASGDSHYAETRSSVPIEERAIQRWSRPAEIAPGLIRNFAVVFPDFCLTSGSEPPSKRPPLRLIPPPPNGSATYVNLYVADQGFPQRTLPTPVGAALPLFERSLPDNTRLLIVAHEESLDEGTRVMLVAARDDAYAEVAKWADSLGVPIEEVVSRAFAFSVFGDGTRSLTDIGEPTS